MRRILSLLLIVLGLVAAAWAVTMAGLPAIDGEDATFLGRQTIAFTGLALVLVIAGGALLVASPRR